MSGPRIKGGQGREGREAADLPGLIVCGIATAAIWAAALWALNWVMTYSR